MTNFNIPNIIYSGLTARGQRRRWRGALLAALLLHIVFFTTWEHLRGIPLFLTAFTTPPELLRENRPLQFITVDNDLPDEELPPEEAVKLRGKVSRISRDVKIDKNLPVTGPSGDKAQSFDMFKPGQLSPADTSVPSPGNPVPPTPPAAESPATPESPAAPEKITRIPEKTPETPPVEKNTAEEKSTPPPLQSDDFIEPELTDNPEPFNMAMANSSQKALPLPTPPAPRKKLEPEEKKNIEKTLDEYDKLVKHKEIEKTPPVPAPQAQENPRPPSRAAAASRPAVPRRRAVPTRRLRAASPAANGGALRRTSGRAAMQASAQSLAVLRDRYGEYMDAVLRRIQQAIFIQQQITPMMFNQGAVVMAFTINAEGRLENIRYLAASSDELVQEKAAARQVLKDVRDGEPLPRPTAEMLADPEFKKITINFIFAPL